MKEKPLEFVERLKWKHRITSDGKEIETECPFSNCPNQGQPQFYISTNGKGWYCHRCGSKGRNTRELELKLGLIKFLDPVLSEHIVVSMETVKQMHSALFKQTEALRYLQEERGFTDSDISQAQLGFKVIDGRNAIVIPYFDNTLASCVGLKYYFYDSFSDPKCRFEKDSKLIFYRLSQIDHKQPVIVTEGEFDALSLWHYGFFNVVSVPNGAQSNGEFIEELTGFPLIYIAYDEDTAGQKGAVGLAKLLGLSKCSRVHLKLKDFNEYLQSGLSKEDVKEAIKNAEPMFKTPVYSVSDFGEELKSLLESPELFKGYSTGWKGIDECIGGIRLGELTVFSGIASHGKTTFSTALAANLLKHGLKTLVLSSEMREADVLLSLVNNHYKRQVTDFKDVTNMLPLFLDNVYIGQLYNEWTRKTNDDVSARVFDFIEHSAKYKGVKFFILDHMRHLLSIKNQDNERLAIENFIINCSRLAKMYGVHIWLIVQPRKMEGERNFITMHDLKGSANIEQDTHNIVLIHRIDNDLPGLVKMEFPKVRSIAGKIGSCMLRFNLESRANYEDFKSE